MEAIRLRSGYVVYIDQTELGIVIDLASPEEEGHKKIATIMRSHVGNVEPEAWVYDEKMRYMCTDCEEQYGAFMASYDYCPACGGDEVAAMIDTTGGECDDA
jgi:Zn finger protein HypA/HybF involved in hydrogenase expression